MLQIEFIGLDFNIMLQLTWKFVHIDIELESNGLEFKHLEIESIGLDLVSL